MESTLLDIQRLETFLVIGIDYQDLLNDVIHDVPIHLQQIHTAIQDGNGPELKTLAHSLRGPLAYFGCVAMTARLADLETRETVHPEESNTILADLQALWNQSLAAIKEWGDAATTPPP